MTHEHAAAEGWYQDPYGVHEARWFSDGTPTALVRDGDTEAHDPPPADAAAGSVEPVELPVRDSGPNDLLRADEAPERTAADTVFDVEGQYGPLH